MCPRTFPWLLGSPVLPAKTMLRIQMKRRCPWMMWEFGSR